MSTQTLPYGSVVTREEGRVVSIADRHGTAWVQASWEGKQLGRATFALSGAREVVLRARSGVHALLGACDTLSAKGRVQTRFSQVDWDKPAFIPAMDNPSALSPGAGSMVLNFLSTLAGGRSLRYRGPYPTAALYDSICRSFEPVGEAHSALGRFTEGVEERALKGVSEEVAVDFRAHPFELLRQGEVDVFLREGVEAVTVGGRSYRGTPGGSRQIRRQGLDFVAYAAIGGEPWVDLCTLNAIGECVSGPFVIPSFDHPLNGDRVPAPMVALILAEIAHAAPSLLQAPVLALEECHTWQFGDAGDENVAFRGGGFVVHSLLLDRLAVRSPERFLRMMIEGARSQVLRLAQGSLSKRIGPSMTRR